MKPARATKFFKFLLITFLLSSAGLPLVSQAGPFPTPDVTGGDEANALQIIGLDPNFEVGTRSENNDDTAAGTVFDQTPNAGTPQDKGTAIDYVVSLGPATTTSTTTTSTTSTTTTSSTSTTTEPGTTTSSTSTEPGTTTSSTSTTTEPGTTTSSTSTTTEPGTTTSSTTTEPGTTTTTVPATTTTTVPTTTTTTLAGGGGTAVIGGCDTGVSDPDGSISAMFARCEGGNNSGQKRSCSQKTIKNLKKSGVITKAEKRAMKQNCPASFYK